MAKISLTENTVSPMRILHPLRITIHSGVYVTAPQSHGGNPDLGTGNTSRADTRKPHQEGGYRWLADPWGLPSDPPTVLLCSLDDDRFLASILNAPHAEHPPPFHI